MGWLALQLLGSPRVERDGVPIEVDTRKAIALLAYLAVTRQPQSREILAELFWPEVDEGRAALRRTLSSLNKALAGRWLEVDRDTIGLKADDGIWIDVDCFQTRLSACRTHGHPTNVACDLCLPLLTEAANLYRDDFLAGFALRDSPAFDDWQLFQAENLRRDFSHVLERLVRYRRDHGEPESAIAYARRWLTLDPLQEAAHRQLMELYARTGQRAGALRQYRECVRVLDRELGVEPLEATNHLYEEIKENRLPPLPAAPIERPARPSPAATPPTSEAPLSRPAEYPLVGRSQDWSVLHAAYNAIAADGHLLVLEGEAGIGKTRLAETLLEHARQHGASVATMRCYEGEGQLAYAPIIAGLEAAMHQPGAAQRLEKVPPEWLGEARRLLPGLASQQLGQVQATPLDSPGAQSRFFEGVSQVLFAGVGGPPPGILFVDDLHWADAASLDLLTYLVRRLQGHPIGLLVTWRSEHVPADHRLRHLLAEARRRRLATSLTLQRLDRMAISELVRKTQSDSLQRFAGEPGAKNAVERLADRLYQETEGVPFFVVEYLSAIARLVGQTGGEAWSLPNGARDLLRSRLAAIGDTGWQVLNAAAAIGRSFDFETVRAVSGRSEEETIAALEELIRHGLVAEVEIRDLEGTLPAGDGPRYDFSHEKLRALVYEDTSLARRRLLHRRIAEALTARARPQRERGAMYGLIANHLQLAGQDGEAAEYFKLAGEHARGLYANAEALAHFRSALALGHPQPATLYEGMGDVQTLLGEYRAALNSYETSAAFADSDALAGLEHKLGSLHHRRGEWELAESHYHAALTSLGEGGPAAERAKAYADWGLSAYRRGQPDRARNLVDTALQLAEAAEDLRALARVHNLLGILANAEGDRTLARQHLEQSLAFAERLGDPSARVAAMNNLALANAAAGEIATARSLVESALALCVSLGDRHREAALENHLADLLHASGQSEAALSHLTRAVSIFAEIGAEGGTLQPEIWKLVEW